jgi:hypothetical protein
MPRIVPSQVVDFIDRVFEWAAKEMPGVGTSLGEHHTGPLSGLLQLLDEMPGELLVLTSKEYATYVCSVAAIRNKVAQFQSGQHHISPLGLLPGFVYGPVTLIRKALLTCADEGPGPATSTLDFISESDLRDQLRSDIGSMDTAFGNGEWKATTVLGGSIIEALLLWVLSKQKPETVLSTCAALRKHHLTAQLDHRDWSLQDYIEVAEEIGVIKNGTAVQAKLAKDYRNLIHPSRVQRLNTKCDRATALAALSAVAHVIRDLDAA